MLAERTESNLVVKIESFSRLFLWLGPLSQERTFLRELMEVLAEPWFHGDISKSEAQVLSELSDKCRSLSVTAVHRENEKWKTICSVLSVAPQHEGTY